MGWNNVGQFGYREHKYSGRRCNCNAGNSRLLTTGGENLDRLRRETAPAAGHAACSPRLCAASCVRLITSAPAATRDGPRRPASAGAVSKRVSGGPADAGPGHKCNYEYGALLCLI
ncbi:hypothetical protein EVAR_32588_1 [Eumeta japonica]|uniref:Uncharacterized protein n=1 Tax=Eumeta variegata TaxID=151549 RepID=A0A4C1VTK0_EUMVA|nr:hypothetical protein EVAR_32588_1 [Eumeta japonica]